MLSFIVPISIDNAERVFNLQECIHYYHKDNFVIPTEFIFVESSPKPSNLEIYKYVDKYIFIKSEGPFKKTQLYNNGVKLANGDTFCFLDADIFVNRDSLEDLYTQVRDNNGVYLGYNGVAIYTTRSGKFEFETNLSNWDKICSLIDFNNIRTNFNTSNYLVGNTNAVGGCLLMNKKTYNNIKGFNPNFVGWGYEDNEIISRAKILNVPVYKLNDQRDLLVHLWHDTENVDKSIHPHYKNNESEVRKVESMSKQQLEEYIKTWNV